MSPVVEYWLDSNVFITAKNGPYGFDIAPGFWTFLDQKVVKHAIGSSSIIYDELVMDSNDDLATWVRQRKDSGLFIAPDAVVQGTFGTIADHVRYSYQEAFAEEFL